MADTEEKKIKIDALPTATTLSDTDVLPIVQGASSSRVTKKVSISVLKTIGGETALADLNDVQFSSLSDGQIIKYDSDLGKWINTENSSGASSLEDLTDVSISSPTDGQVLKYDSNSDTWYNGIDESVSSLEDLTDISISSPTNGQVLKYDSGNEVWYNGTDESASTLEDLTDVSINNPSDGQVLKYDADNDIWYNATDEGGGTASEITFDNTDTGLTSTDVQDAIVEVKNAIPIVPDHYTAQNVTYDHTASGLVANNVQAAIDEVVSELHFFQSLGLNYTFVNIQSAEITSQGDLPVET